MPLRRILILAAAVTSINTLAQQPPAPPLAFEVATIKPSARPDGGWRLEHTPDGYTGTNVSLYKLIQEAYGITDVKLVIGGPNWTNTDKFDLEAKFDGSAILDAKNLTHSQRAAMLRPLLADRFRLKVHFETKDFPVYNLVITKGGPKFEQTKSEDPGCALGNRGFGNTNYRGCPVKSLEDLLRYSTGRTVIDKTGLTGRYDFELHWTPENTPADSRDAGRPDIFAALQQQLGLKLEPATAPLDVLVIDSAEKPSEN
jgi:uncharacterized protein (TIGR03435 family)